MGAQSTPEADRLAQATEFLREAVFRSRMGQAGRSLFAAGAGVKGQCGLGDEAVVVLELSPRAQELSEQLWPDGLQAAALRQVDAVMRAWVERQDALDRDRNHHLKRVRLAHGMDRNGWSAEVLAAFEAGLEELHRIEDEERTQAAAQLLQEAASPGD
ncbi:MAG: hypothetical protein ISQ08_01280 [Planctomycetes bacterium]|nr:hypothetical protein [Planctomycetota bacterium]